MWNMHKVILSHTVTGGEAVDVPNVNEVSSGIIFLALPCPSLASLSLFPLLVGVT